MYVYVWCVCDQILFLICVCFAAQELSLVSWKAATQAAQMTNHGWKVREPPQSLTLPPLTYNILTAEMSQHNQRKPSPLRLCRWGNDAKVMQARSQLRYKVAIWERSANPAANVRSSGQLAEILPAAGVGERGWRCQQAGASAWEIRPAAWLSGWQDGCAVGSGITLHRCANSSSAQHLCPPPSLQSLPFARRQDSQMLAKLQRTARSSPLSLKSDQNNHRWLWIGGGVCWLFKARMRHLAIHKTPPALLWRQAKR